MTPTVAQKQKGYLTTLFPERKRGRVKNFTPARNWCFMIENIPMIHWYCIQSIICVYIYTHTYAHAAAGSSYVFIAEKTPWDNIRNHLPWPWSCWISLKRPRSSFISAFFRCTDLGPNRNMPKKQQNHRYQKWWERWYSPTFWKKNTLNFLHCRNRNFGYSTLVVRLLVASQVWSVWCSN